MKKKLMSATGHTSFRLPKANDHLHLKNSKLRQGRHHLIHCWWSRVIERLSAIIGIDFKYFLYHGAFTSSSMLLTMLVGILSSLFLTRYFSVQEYGAYLLIFGVVNIVGLIPVAGMSIAILQSVASGHMDSLKRGTWYRIKFSFVAILALLCTSLYFWLHGQDMLFIMSFLAILYLYSGFVLESYIHFYEGIKRFDKSSLLNAIVTIGSTIVAMVTAYVSRDVVFTFGSFCLTHFILTLYFYWITIKFADTLPSKNEDGGLFIFAWNLTIYGSIVPRIVENIDRVIIASYLGLEELASYGVAQIIPMNLHALNKANLRTIAPKLSTELKTTKIVKLIPKLGLSALYALILSSLSIIATIFLVPFLYPSYVKSVLYGVIISLIIVPQTPAYIIDQIINQRKYTQALWKLSLYSGIIYLGLLLLFVWRAGIIGLLLATGIYRLFRVLYGIKLIHEEENSIH